MSSLARPEDAVIVIFCSFPVPRSLAETFRMPLASMSNALDLRKCRAAPTGFRSMEYPEGLVVPRHLPLP
jgi:hypothetical protein